MGIYKEYAPKLWENGWVTVPCDGKRPRIDGWTIWPDDKDLQENKINEFIERKPNWNIGIMTGKINNMAILDVDTWDENFVKEFLKFLPPFQISKTGEKGFSSPIKYEGQENLELEFMDKNNKRWGIELLSDGRQTVLPPSIHPDIKVPYKYTTHLTFENTINGDMDFPAIDWDYICAEFRKLCIKYIGVECVEKSKDVASRNKYLTKVTYALLHKKDSLLSIIDEIIAFDKETHEKPLFEDKSEFKNTLDTPFLRAEIFVKSILKTMRKHQPAVAMKFDVKEDKEAHNIEQALYPTKANGFFIKQMIGEGDDVKVIYHPDYEGMCKYFKNEIGLVVTSGWQYSYKNNHYIQFDDLWLDKKIDKLTKLKPTVAQVSPHIIASFKKKVRAWCLHNENDFEKTKGLINLKNGILCVKNREIIPHDKKYFFKYVSEIEFDKNAQCQLWNKFLREVFDNDEPSIKFLAEAFGYTILGGYPFLHRSFCLYGTGRNGKSVVLSVLKALLSEKNCSFVSMDILGKQFSLVMLMDKLANITNEMPRDTLNSEIFKKIVGGDEVIASYKRKDEFSFNPTARLWTATNDIPRFNESTKGLHSKICYLVFNRVFEGDQIDIGLTKKLLTELPGILNWALDGLDRLLKQNDFTRVEKSMQIQLEHKIESSSVINFIETQFQTLEEGKFTYVNWDGFRISDTYAGYLNFCESEGVKNFFSKKVYSRKFKEYLFEKYGASSCYPKNGFFWTKKITLKRPNDAKYNLNPEDVSSMI